MKIRVYKDNVHHYGIAHTERSYVPDIEITEEEYRFILEAERIFEKAQKILARAYERRDDNGNRNSS